MKLRLLLSGFAILLTGCQTTRQLYYWGSYETINYLAYSKPEKATLEVQREKLEEDLEKAKARSMPIHPGLYAQLGYIHYQLGNLELAQRAFTEEKNRFPESAAFMDHMIEKIKGGASK